MNKHILAGLLFLFFFCTGISRAQQQALYSQYMLNEYLINPAVAGDDGYTSVNFTARDQWVGIENSPKTFSVGIQTRLLKRNYIIKNNIFLKKKTVLPGRSGRVGLGAAIYNDRNGLINRTGFQGTYAYHIFIRSSQLSFGLTGSAFQFKILDNIQIHDPSDPIINSGLRRSLIVPDASAGIYLSNDHYYTGASVTQLFQSILKFGNSDLKGYKMCRCYYFMGGYRFELSPDYNLEPSLLVMSPENLLAQADINCKLYYLKDFWGGLSYRTNKTFVAMAGMRINRLYIGYSFDYTLSSLRRQSFGSHEITIALKYGDNARRFLWLNRY